MTHPSPERIYRRQRYLYDATRPLFLVGRNRLLDGISAPAGGTVLEIGCGTARNLIHLGRRHAGWKLYGLDASPSMLQTAARRIPRELLARIRLALGDAVDWDPSAAFGQPLRFDAIFFSYSLSMIREPRQAIETAARFLAADGSVHLVDFGDASIRRAPWIWGLGRWLEWWQVRPASELLPWLGEVFGGQAGAPARPVAPRPRIERIILRRGYAQVVRVRPPADATR